MSKIRTRRVPVSLARNLAQAVRPVAKRLKISRNQLVDCAVRNALLGALRQRT